MKKGFLIGGIGALVIGGALLGRYLWVRNKRKKIAETLDSKLGGERTSTTSSGSTSDSKSVFPLGKGSGMGSSTNAMGTVKVLQKALNKLKPSVMLDLVVDGKFGSKTENMLISVSQKYPSLGIGSKKTVSQEVFGKIVDKANTMMFTSIWK